MDVISKARVLAVKQGRAIVEVGRTKRIVDVRPDLRIKAGDIVVVAFNVIVDKVNL
jgi:Trk K+ transport system NAD-binding subunit